MTWATKVVTIETTRPSSMRLDPRIWLLVTEECAWCRPVPEAGCRIETGSSVASACANACAQLLAARGQQSVVGVAVEYDEPTAAALVACGETLAGELHQSQQQHQPRHAPKSQRTLGRAQDSHVDDPCRQHELPPERLGQGCLAG